MWREILPTPLNTGGFVFSHLGFMFFRHPVWRVDLWHVGYFYFWGLVVSGVWGVFCPFLSLHTHFSLFSPSSTLVTSLCPKFILPRSDRFTLAQCSNGALEYPTVCGTRNYFYTLGGMESTSLAQMWGRGYVVLLKHKSKYVPKVNKHSILSKNSQFSHPDSNLYSFPFRVIKSTDMY